MEVVGLDYSKLNLGQLDQLVGYRNQFSHGQFTDDIGYRKFSSLVRYTQELIEELSREVQQWMEKLVSDLEGDKHHYWAPFKCKSYSISHVSFNFT
ncbi:MULTISPECIES: HEPN domain-containing protein [unclassified Salinivibrio]